VQTAALPAVSSAEGAALADADADALAEAGGPAVTEAGALRTPAEAAADPAGRLSAAFAPMLAPVNAPAGPAPAAPPAALPVAPGPAAHVYQDGFADEVGTQVQWLADRRIGHALIRVTPQDLGSVEVRLQLDGDRVSADFTSAHAEVRQALEQGLPRLRELLGQHGLQLAHAGVGQQSPQGGRDGGDAAASSADRAAAADDRAGTAAAAPLPRRMRAGLLDAYA